MLIGFKIVFWLVENVTVFETVTRKQAGVWRDVERRTTAYAHAQFFFSEGFFS